MLTRPTSLPSQAISMLVLLLWAGGSASAARKPQALAAFQSADTHADADADADTAAEPAEGGKGPAARADGSDPAGEAAEPDQAQDAEPAAADAGAGDAKADPVKDFLDASPGAETAEEGSPPDALDEVDAQASVESRQTLGGQPELTVLPIHNAAGRPFDLAVGRHLMEGLVNVTHLTPLPATRAMVAKMHPRPQDLHLPTTLTTLGKRMRVPYVLVVEAVGAPRPSHVFIGLVEVKSGATLLAYRAKMPRGVLTAELGLDLAARVRAALRHPAQLRRAAQARDRARAGRAQAAAAPGQADEAGDQATGGREDALRDEPAAEADAPSSRASKKKPRRQQASELDAQLADARDTELPRAMLDKGRGWFRLQMMQRVSRLNVADVDGTTPPCYCGSKTSANPFFPALALGGEVFSSAFTGQRRRLQDNFGLRADLGFAPVRSYIKGDSKKTVSSSVVQVQADALYRFIWLPKRALSPDATVGVGLSYYTFPLKNVAYPGVAYLAPNLQLDLNVPLHDLVGFTGSVAVRPGMLAGGDARKYLGKPGRGLGLMLGLGLRGHWRLLEAEVKFRLESYGANFKGPTTLPNTPNGVTSGTPVQYNNVRLRDSLKEIILQVGVTL